jgi:trk system potassium uptake protein TrkA
MLADTGSQPLPHDVILVAVNRGDDLLVPKGNTTLQSGDVGTVFSLRGITDTLMRSFEAD